MKSRNARGNGSVRQRQNGTWEARCIIDGKRRSFYGEKQSDVLKAMRAAQKATGMEKSREAESLTGGVGSTSEFHLWSKLVSNEYSQR